MLMMFLKLPLRDVLEFDEQALQATDVAALHPSLIAELVSVRGSQTPYLQHAEGKQIDLGELASRLIAAQERLDTPSIGWRSLAPLRRSQEALGV